jgi:hypothetical protein
MSSSVNFMKRVVFGLLVLGLLTVPAHAASLKLTISDGKVSIDAQDVTIRQILSEWARLGQTKITNLERLTSGPITLKLVDVPEKEALETLLRNVPGYMAAPRASYVPGASVYDRILIMATTSTPPPATAATGRPTAPFPAPFSPNVTQLRGNPPAMTPGTLPEPPPDGPEAQDDPAIAAAAAAGLVTVPAPMPPPTALNPGTPFMAPPGAQPPGTQPPAQAQPATPTTTTPPNPWNAPAGAARPGLAPPPPPAPATTLPPNLRPRPPQADR